MSVYKNGNNWMYDFQFKKQRFTKKGFQRKCNAIEAENIKRDQLRGGKSPARMMVRELVIAFLQFSRATKSKRWVKDLRWKLNRVLGPVFDRTIDDVPRTDLEGLIYGQGERTRRTATDSGDTNGATKLKPRTVNEYRRIVHAMFQYAVANDLLRKNPCANIPDVPEDDVAPYVPPHRDVQALRMAARPSDRDFLDVLIYTYSGFWDRLLV
jgi:hypothetical protein